MQRKESASEPVILSAAGAKDVLLRQAGDHLHVELPMR